MGCCTSSPSPTSVEWLSRPMPSSAQLTPTKFKSAAHGHPSSHPSAHAHANAPPHTNPASPSSRRQTNYDKNGDRVASNNINININTQHEKPNQYRDRDRDRERERERERSREDERNDTPILNSRYQLYPGTLGKGHFAKVKKCRDIHTHIDYAIKIIDKKELIKSHAVVKQEIDILKAVGQHQHIVSLIDTFEDDTKFYLVMELCNGGDLFSKIVEQGKYTEAQAVRCCRQLARALQYIHKCGVTHRDLKPENILLTSNDIDGDIKVADFGLSKLMKHQDHVMKTVCGTWAYCAPEVITRKPYTQAVDTWTLGVLMFILLSGYHPFDVYGEMPEPQLLQKIVACEYDFEDPVWEHVSSEAKHLIQRLLQLQPEKRMSLEDFLRSPWIAEGKGAGTTNLPTVVDRLSKLSVGGRRAFRTLVIAKLASQKFKASISRSMTPQQCSRQLRPLDDPLNSQKSSIMHTARSTKGNERDRDIHTDITQTGTMIHPSTLDMPFHDDPTSFNGMPSGSQHPLMSRGHDHSLSDLHPHKPTLQMDDDGEVKSDANTPVSESPTSGIIRVGAGALAITINNCEQKRRDSTE